LPTRRTPAGQTTERLRGRALLLKPRAAGR